MASNRNDQLLVPSLLDRLLDDDPGVTREPHASQRQVLQDLKQTVRRDLENLLNTRVRNTTWPEELEELDHSLINYGLPDFTGMSLASAEDRENFCRMLEVVIRQNEPRLQNVRARPLSDAEPVDRTFRFRIDALLRAEPAPEPVAFDSVVQPVTGNFEVRGTNR